MKEDITARDWQLDSEMYSYNLMVLADLDSTGLFSDIGWPLYPRNSPLAAEIWQALFHLVRDYDAIYDMSEEETERQAARWDALDRRGFELALIIDWALGGTPPVLYFSLARGRYIYSCTELDSP